MSFLLKNIYSKIKFAFPTPKYLTFGTFGLDIAPDGIRVMQLKSNRKGYVPYKYREYKFENEYDFSDDSFDLINNQDILNTLKKAKKDLNIKYVVSSLPEFETYIYKTLIPTEALSNIASFIRFQIEDNVPLSVNEVNFDYKIIGDLNKEKIEVVVSVFPKKVIQTYTDLLKKAGLFNISFQSDSVAISKAVVKRGDRKPYLIARFLPHHTNIFIIEDEAVQFTSSINVGSLDIQCDASSEDKLKTLKEDLNKTLIYWFTNNTEAINHSKIETIYLVGNNSCNEDIINYLEKHLKINAEFANVWNNSFDFSKYVPKIKKEESLNYSVAIGLALKAIRHA